MNETLKKFNDEARKALVESLTAKSVIDLIASIKSASSEDSGTFKVVVSTADQDRQGEVVDQNGWDLSFYKANPVVLWAHDYASLPIGVCTNIYTENGKTIAEGKFAPADANPFAQQVRKLYELGMVNTTSVGFIPKEYDNARAGYITKAELLEFSFVPVPANPHALRLDQVKKLNLDLALLKTKSIEITVKEAQAGDRCQMQDGTDGVLAADPKNPDGAMICVPAKSDSKGMDEHMRKLAAMHVEHSANCTKALEAFKEAMKSVDVSKSIDIEKMESYKTLESAISLENERHSKAIDQHVTDMAKAFAESEDEGGNPTTNGMKGEVADKLTAIEISQLKWQNYHEVLEALDAFASVYFDENTPAEKFEELLTETAQILLQIAKNPDDGDADNKIAKMQGDRKSLNLLAGEKIVKLHSLLDTITKEVIALGGIRLPEGNSASAGDNGGTQRSKTSDGLAELNDFIETRTLLRSMDNSLEKVLRRFNEAARTYESK